MISGVLYICGASCKICSDVIYSRCKEDSRKCSCGTVKVTGGIDNLQAIYHTTNQPFNIVRLEILATQKELHLDYVANSNNYGIIINTYNNN